MVSTRFVLVITFWSYQCLPDFLMANSKANVAKRYSNRNPFPLEYCELYHCYINYAADPNAVVTLKVLHCQVEDTAVSSTIIRYVLNLNAEITQTR